MPRRKENSTGNNEEIGDVLEDIASLKARVLRLEDSISFITKRLTEKEAKTATEMKGLI